MREGITLPFPIPSEDQTVEINNLLVSFKTLGDLFLVNLRLLGPLDLLSNREKQVVELICKGLSFKEAAKILTVAPSTVSNHLYQVYDKLGIRSRTELAQLVDKS
jgi:DNA-binding NarL/FixJ family response regulator